MKMNVNKVFLLFHVFIQYLCGDDVFRIFVARKIFVHTYFFFGNVVAFPR